MTFIPRPTVVYLVSFEQFSPRKNFLSNHPGVYYFSRSIYRIAHHFQFTDDLRK